MAEHNLFIEEVQARLPFYKRVKTLFNSSVQAAGVMLLAAVTAIIIANSAISGWFSEFWHTSLVISLGEFSMQMSLGHIINDIFMAVFFLLIGLEVKYELTVGALRNIRQAILPIIAAAGGVLVPIVIYLAFNAGNPETAHGWGIPTATDIAFALGIIALLGNRVPVGIKVFLSTLAVADDIVAILIIAIFYGAAPSFLWLGAAAIVMVVLVCMNRRHVYSLAPYILLGIVLWFCVYQSGVHSTIAGVLLAFAIPSGSRVDIIGFMDWSGKKVEKANAEFDESSPLVSQKEYITDIAQLSKVAQEAVPPSVRLEQALHPWVYFAILPLFALTNADVVLIGVDISTFFSNPALVGIFLGLVLGKPIGVLLFSFIIVKLKVAQLPAQVNWGHMIGAGILAGVGFTMSIFVANLAFSDPGVISAAKVGILSASLVAGITGYLVLFWQSSIAKKKGLNLNEEESSGDSDTYVFELEIIDKDNIEPPQKEQGAVSKKQKKEE